MSSEMKAVSTLMWSAALLLPTRGHSVYITKEERHQTVGWEWQRFSTKS
jgi:hypothetical protein